MQILIRILTSLLLAWALIGQPLRAVQRATFFGQNVVAATGGNTFTLIQHPMNGVGACNGGGGADCSLTVTSTGAGHVGIFCVLNANGAQGHISSISGAGTWTVPAGAQTFNANEGDVSCAYTLSTSAATTSITVTLTAGIASQVSLSFWEYSFTPGAVAIDTTGAVRDSSGAATQNGVTLTLSGTSDIIVQAGILSGGAATSVDAPYGNFINVDGNFKFLADNENTSSGTAPTFNLNSSRTAIFAAIAVK